MEINKGFTGEEVELETDGQNGVSKTAASQTKEDVAKMEDDSRPKTASKAFEQILFKVGDYHYYQWKLMIITGVCGLFTSCHNMGATLLAASPDHWCNIPYFKENDLSLDKDSLNYTAPSVIGKGGTEEPSKCTYYNFNYSLLGIDLPPDPEDYTPDLSVLANLPEPSSNSCDSWVYDDSVFKSTVVTEWDLVCKNRWMMSSTQATYMMGILTGAVLFSAISDRVGRRISTLICCCLFFIASVSAAFTTSFTLFLILRFIVAGSGQGMFLVNFILLMESVSLKGRNVMGNLFHVFFSIGFLAFSGIGYAIREWRNLQLAISVPTVILLGYYWLLPESSRWLLMQGREEEGLVLLKDIAKANERPFPTDEELKPLLMVIKDEVDNKEKQSLYQKITVVFKSVVTLVRTPNMRRRNLITFYTWFVTSMIYYGLSFSGSNLNASPYATVAISAAVEFPALLCVIFLLFKFERRIVLSGSFLLGGIACIAIILLPAGMSGWNLAFASFGKFCVTNCFCLVFMFSAELVPTYVRNIAIGMASLFARIGSGIAPYIVDLLGDIYFAIPSTIFGILAIIAGLLSLLLPDTGKDRMPESVEEIEAMPR